MPYYQFTLPRGSASTSHKAELAAAFTKVHTEVTGAPSNYVNCAFTEVDPGSIFVADQAVEQGRMVGLIRSGRTPEVKRQLLTELSQAWAEVTGEPREGFALFLHEVPGYQVMEDGEILPEA